MVYRFKFIKTLFTFLFLVISIGAFSQEEKYKENVFDVLSDGQRKDWTKAKDNWQQTYFLPFLKKQKIKMSCASCASVYINVSFEVMDDGHAHAKVVWTKKCGSEFSAKQIKELEKLLYNFQFMPGLYNTKFIARLGTSLKC